jgi:hypothetical protein
MREGPGHRRLRRAAAGAALLIVAGVVWIVLDRTEGRPGWLTAEAPAKAVVGRPFEVRITLERSIDRSQIGCALQRANSWKKDWAFLASSGPARPAAGRVTYSFVFTVPEHEDTAFVFALVFLSPTGEWPQATRAASTEYIPVGREETGDAILALRRAQVYRYPTAAESEKAKARGVRPPVRPSAWVHPILGALLVAAAALCFFKARRSKPAPPGQARERTVWLALAAVLAASAVLEISGLAGHFAAWGRRLAEQRGLYELRLPFQKLIMAAVAAASLGFLLLFIRATRKPGSHRFLWWAGIGLAAYLALSFVSVLSFHAVDVVRSLTWHGVSPIDGLRGAGAVVTLAAAWLAVRRKAGRAPI